MDHAKNWMIRLGAFFNGKRLLSFLFKGTSPRDGAHSVSFEYLKAHGAHLDPKEASGLLYRHVQRRLVPDRTTEYLEELGACLDEDDLSRLSANSTFIREAAFVTERLLVLLVSNARHREAWALTIKAHDQWLLGDKLLGNGLLRLFHESIKRHRDAGTNIDHNQSILDPTTAKLNLLYQPKDLHDPCIPYPFHLWLSHSLTRDMDPNIEWIHVRKFRKQLRIQKDVLVF